MNESEIKGKSWYKQYSNIVSSVGSWKQEQEMLRQKIRETDQSIADSCVGFREKENTLLAEKQQNEASVTANREKISQLRSEIEKETGDLNKLKQNFRSKKLDSTQLEIKSENKIKSINEEISALEKENSEWEARNNAIDIKILDIERDINAAENDPALRQKKDQYEQEIALLEKRILFAQGLSDVANGRTYDKKELLTLANELDDDKKEDYGKLFAKVVKSAENPKTTHQRKKLSPLLIIVLVCACCFLVSMIPYVVGKLEKQFGKIDLTTITETIEGTSNAAAAPVRHWDFSKSLDEESGNVSVTQGDAKLVTLKGTETKVAKFDGDNDYIECGNDLNFTDNETFTFMLRCDDVDSEDSAFFAKYQTSNYGPYAFFVRKGKIFVQVSDIYGEEKLMSGRKTIYNCVWYHVAIVKSGGQFELYIDGRNLGKIESNDPMEIATSKKGINFENTNEISTNNDIVTIGGNKHGDSVSNDFNGMIKDIAIYDYAMSAEEINEDYKRQHSFIDEFPQSIPDNAYSYNGSYYYVFNNCADYAFAAAEYCKQQGGHLAVMPAENTEEFNSLLYSYVQEQGYNSAFFGLQINRDNPVWSWVEDQGGATEMLWNIKEANWVKKPSLNIDSIPQSYRFGMYYSSYKDGTWHAGEWSSDIPFICQWDPEGGAETSAE